MRRAARWSRSAFTPPMRTSPESGRTSPVTISTNVVFPAPLWPIRPTISPAPTSRLKPSSAAVVPYLLTSPAATSIGNRRPAVVIYTVYDLQCKAMEDRRQVILDAAMALADERGLDAVSMRAVAGRGGVTPTALYPHVASTADFLHSIMTPRSTHLLPP